MKSSDYSSTHTAQHLQKEKHTEYPDIAQVYQSNDVELAQ